MSKAYVYGVGCVVYGFMLVNGTMYCKLKHPFSSVVLPIPADLVEVVNDGD